MPYRAGPAIGMLERQSTGRLLWGDGEAGREEMEGRRGRAAHESGYRADRWLKGGQTGADRPVWGGQVGKKVADSSGADIYG